VFSWPSKAKLFDYGYDRESAMWSRDELERVLSLLIASPAVGRIHVVAHSVGTMLSMESLRQIYARHGMAITDKIGAVIFASPDIDMDVFTSSVERIPPLAPPTIARSRSPAGSPAGRHGSGRRKNPSSRSSACASSTHRRKGGASSTTTSSCRTTTFAASSAAPWIARRRAIREALSVIRRGGWPPNEVRRSGGVR